MKYLSRRDPIFNASILSIVNRASIPKNEADQSLYNMLVETYGTHYVTHVIIGATAHMYTFVNESYVKSSSYEEMTTQVSRSGFFLFFGGVSSSNTHQVSHNVSESFRKNSQSISIYQPPVIQAIGKTEWQ